MQSDTKGASTCGRGAESYEAFNYRGKTFYQYDYRSDDTGELFSCCAPSLEMARERRDKWIKAGCR